MLIAAAYDLYMPQPGALDRRGHLWALIHLAQQGFDAVAVLYVNQVDQYAQQQARVSVRMWRLRPRVFLPAS